MTELPVQRLLLDVVAVLDGLRLPYAVIGGFAVRVWGVPRPTYDIDLAVAAAPEDLIAMKLVAHRRKDQLDVEEILAITPDLDLDHLRAQARRLGVEELLEGFLSERG